METIFHFTTLLFLLEYFVIAKRKRGKPPRRKANKHCGRKKKVVLQLTDSTNRTPIQYLNENECEHLSQPDAQVPCSETTTKQKKSIPNKTPASARVIKVCLQIISA